METFETSNIPLYKIGTDWVFNIQNRTGYFVERNNCKQVKKFKKAFVINKDNETAYSMQVPLGVIRKANRLIELQSEGKI